MNILGVSCYHHDSAAASLKNGLILGAAHEERFTRKKYDNSFPIKTIEWLRDTYHDWEIAAFYEETTYKQFKIDNSLIELRSKYKDKNQNSNENEQ